MYPGCGRPLFPRDHQSTTPPGAENTVPEDAPQRRPATDVRPAQPRSAGGLLHTVTERLFQTRWATARDALAPDVARSGDGDRGAARHAERNTETIPLAISTSAVSRSRCDCRRVREQPCGGSPDARHGYSATGYDAVGIARRRIRARDDPLADVRDVMDHPPIPTAHWPSRATRSRGCAHTWGHLDPPGSAQLRSPGHGGIQLRAPRTGGRARNLPYQLSELTAAGDESR